MGLNFRFENGVSPFSSGRIESELQRHQTEGPAAKNKPGAHEEIVKAALKLRKRKGAWSFRAGLNKLSHQTDEIERRATVKQQWLQPGFGWKRGSGNRLPARDRNLPSKL